MSHVTPDFRPAFSRYPFVYLCCYFCMGIFLAEKWLWNQDLLLLLSSLLLVSAGISNTYFRFDILPKQLFLLWSFSLLGYLAHHEQEQQSGWSNWHFHRGKSTFEVKITEFQSHSDWSKAIACIHWKDGAKIFDMPVCMYIRAKKLPKLDDVLRVTTQIIRMENKGNPGEFDLKTYWKTKGIEGMCFIEDTDFNILRNEPASWLTQSVRKANQLCMDILASHLKGTELGIAQALILGDKSMLDNEIRSAFSATGAMHILAVSGLHIGLILQLLIFLMQFAAHWISRSKAIFFIVVLLWFYALMTGFSPSVIRAVFMFSVLTLTQWTGIQISSINSLFFTAFVIVLIKPMYFFDIGFQLSYLAMLGIFLFYPIIEKSWTPSNKILAYLWEGTAIGFAAQVVTTPLTLYYFHQFPNYFAVANLGLMGLSSVVLAVGIFILGLHFVPLIGKLSGIFLFLTLWMMFAFIQWIESWPGALVYGFELALYWIPFLFFIAAVLLLGNPSEPYWRINAVHFIVILSLIIWKRWRNIQEDHLCILNENKCCILVKKNQQMYCFYNDDNPDKIKFSVQNYLKIFPGEPRYYSIKHQNVHVDNERFTLHLDWHKKDLLIQLNTHRIAILSEASSKQNSTTKSYYMPWVEHPNSLKFGAKFIHLSSN